MAEPIGINLKLSDLDTIQELYEAAKAVHAALRDEYIPHDCAYVMGYEGNENYDLLRRFEDAILSLGPLAPPTYTWCDAPADNRMLSYEQKYGVNL
jgi:hypothetical protein